MQGKAMRQSEPGGSSTGATPETETLARHHPNLQAESPCKHTNCLVKTFVARDHQRNRS